MEEQVKPKKNCFRNAPAGLRGQGIRLVPAVVAKDSTLNLTWEISQETWWGHETDTQTYAWAPAVPACPGWAVSSGRTRPPPASTASKDITTVSHSKSGGKGWSPCESQEQTDSWEILLTDPKTDWEECERDAFPDWREQPGAQWENVSPFAPWLFI